MVKRTESKSIQSKAIQSKATVAVQPEIIPASPAKRKPKTATGEESILLNNSPAWLNWAAVTLAVLIVAGIFLLSARQLNAPQGGVSANHTNGIPADVGGMRLDSAGLTEGNGAEAEGAAPVEATPSPWDSVEPGEVLSNPSGRVSLYADADMGASFLDSYGRGGVFVLLEPTGDFEGYPVRVDDVYWVRVRASDGLVGWTPAEMLEIAP